MIVRMKTIMKLDELKTITQWADFLSGNQAVAFVVVTDKDERYQFIEKMLKRFHYQQLSRKDKGVLIQFLSKLSGYSRQQLTRLIQQYLKLGGLKRRQVTARGFQTKYTTGDIRLLAELDKRHDAPNGLMVKKLCKRACHQFHDEAYRRLADISVSHIYNLKHSQKYKKYRWNVSDHLYPWLR